MFLISSSMYIISLQQSTHLFWRQALSVSAGAGTGVDQQVALGPYAPIRIWNKFCVFGVEHFGFVSFEGGVNCAHRNCSVIQTNMWYLKMLGNLLQGSTATLNRELMSLKTGNMRWICAFKYTLCMQIFEICCVSESSHSEALYNWKMSIKHSMFLFVCSCTASFYRSY